MRSYITLAALLLSFPSAAYERAISLAPHITELIYAIGAEDRLVATVNSSDYPLEAKQLPRVGDGVSVAAEALLKHHPDVVLAWQPTKALQALEELLEQNNVALHYINPQSLEDIATATVQLGDWLDQPQTAQALSEQWQAELQSLHAARAQQNTPPKTLFIALNSAPLYSLNDALTNDVLQTCGAKNWAANSSSVAPLVNKEQLFTAALDGIIYTSRDTALEQLLELLAGVQAQPLATYQVDADAFYRAGPRLFEATKALCAQLL